ncbi:hypothetical protein AMJ57_04385 [Parcubacteria bacterium SG8_24]|nr:MAG: hypothetical protein AMJ57_04385 [Parcubacteria bacterium SG8_24]
MRCPACGSESRADCPVVTQEADRRQNRSYTAFRCGRCNLLFLEDYREDRSHLYDDDYGTWGRSAGDREGLVATVKRATFRRQLQRLMEVAALPSADGRRLLDVGTGPGYLLEAASGLGFDVYGVEPSGYAADRAAERFPGRVHRGRLSEAGFGDDVFDVVSLTDVLEHVSEPVTLAAEVSRVLKPGGVALIITPNAASWTRRLMGRYWFQYKYEHVMYWDAASLRHLLDRTGLRLLSVENNRKWFSPAYYRHYLGKYSVFGPCGRIISGLCGVLPRSWQERHLANPFLGELLAVAVKRK